MPKVLLLPLLQIPSGHHQVADAVARWLHLKHTQIEIAKVELISSFNRLIEKMVSHTYLKWIERFPNTYAWLYRQLAYNTTPMKRDHHKGYEWLFLSTVREIIDEHQPDIIICTHALPSYLCSKLKIAGELTQPVVNMYTDFFANRLWGMAGIEIHFAPTRHVKEYILQQVDPQAQVFVTGIPVDYVFHESNRRKRDSLQHVLIAGGNIGVGIDMSFFQNLQSDDSVRYTVLCGKNQRLYEYIHALGCDHIIAKPYVTCREEMKELYERMDAVITKPGGVTITEAMYAGLPIFIPMALPGQEEINRNYLFEQQIASPIDLTQPLLEQIQQSMSDSLWHEQWYVKMDTYLAELEWDNAISHLIDYLSVDRRQE